MSKQVVTLAQSPECKKALTEWATAAKELKRLRQSQSEGSLSNEREVQEAISEVATKYGDIQRKCPAGTCRPQTDAEPAPPFRFPKRM